MTVADVLTYAGLAVTAAGFIFSLVYNIKHKKSIVGQIKAAGELITLAQKADPKDWAELKSWISNAYMTGRFKGVNQETLKILENLKERKDNPIGEQAIKDLKEIVKYLEAKGK